MKILAYCTFKYLNLFLLAIVLSLTACGGGGSSSGVVSGDKNHESAVNFSIMPQTGVALSSIVEFNVTNISGIKADTNISVSPGSSYRINGGTYTDYPGVINKNDTLQVRHISSDRYSSSVSTILTIDGVSKVVKSTTKAESNASVTTLNVKDFGAIGDGDTNDTAAIRTAFGQARDAKKNLYFPDGTYLYIGGMNAQGVRFIGQSKAGTIIKSTNMRAHNIDGAENITFQDFKIGDYYGVSKSRIFRNCKFEVTRPVSPSFYLFYTGYYTYQQDVEFTDCDFIFPKIYIALLIRKYNSVLIKNCTFNGDASHNIRLTEPFKRDAQVSIIGNTITGGKTGIFIGSSRVAPLEGGLIEGNTMIDQYEEAIAMDGFGNNAGLVPVIANGPIQDAWNNADGRVVISMNEMVYTDGKTQDIPSPVSLRNDWTNFYFSFGEGSGWEGKIVKIKDFDAEQNTLTLDIIAPASSIQTGGDAGVQGGFFNWIVRGNTVTRINEYNNTYGTGISIYLNVFGILVEDNNVSNFPNGINVTGGQMLTTYGSLAYSNVIRNNTLHNCNRNDSGAPISFSAVRITSIYGGPLQYNNHFKNNTLDVGRIYINRQKSLTFKDNNLGEALLLVDP